MGKQRYPLTSIIGRPGYEGIRRNAYVTEDVSHEPLTVYQSGVKNKNMPGHISGPAMYDHYIIHYITKGKGTYYCRQKEYEVNAGDAFLICPYELVRYQASQEDPYCYLWVGFNGTDAWNLLNLCGYSDTQLTRYLGQEKQITDIMSLIADIESADLSKKYLLTGLLYQLLSVFISLTNNETGITDNNYVYAATRYIRNRLSDSGLTVQKVADHIGINRSHMFRLFEQTYHFSVQHFILSLRFQRAKELLLQTDYTISDIALGCGFSNPAHFTALFTKYIGCSPRTYRNQKTKKKE